MENVLEVKSNPDSMADTPILSDGVNEKSIISLLLKYFCLWIFDEDHICYETECKESFWFEEGTRKENGIEFCPFCGKPIYIKDEK